MSEIVVGIKLKANTSDFSQAAKQAIDSVNALGTAAKNSSSGTDKLNDTLKKAKVNLDDSADGAGRLTGALAKIGHYGAGLFAFNEVKNFTESIIQAGIATDKLNNTFKFTTGSTAGAASEIAYLHEVSSRLGLSLGSTANAYAKLTAASVGTVLAGQQTKDIFEAVSAASTVMGLSADETGGALLAISQMISKGTVSAEELRGQLGERLPGAFQMAARAMGVTTAELGKLLESGSIATTDFLPKLAAEIKKTLGDAPQDAVKGTQAKLNQLSNTWLEFKKNIADSGVITITLVGAETLNNAVKSMNELMGPRTSNKDDQKYKLQRLLDQQQEYNFTTPDWLIAQDKSEINRLKQELGILPKSQFQPSNGYQAQSSVAPNFNSTKKYKENGNEGGGGGGYDARRNEDIAKKANPKGNFLEDTQAEIKAMEQVNALLAEGVPLQEASTRAKLKAHGATDKMIDAYLNVHQAQEKLIDSAKKEKEANEALEKSNKMAWEEHAAILDKHAQLSIDDLNTTQDETLAIEAKIQALKNQNEEYGLSNTALQALKDSRLEATIAELEASKALVEESDLSGSQIQAIDDKIDAIRRLSDEEKKQSTNLDKNKSMAKELGMTFTSAFEDAVINGKKFSDVLSGIGQDIERMLLRRMVTNPLMGAMDNLLGSFDFGSLLNFNAKGNVYQGAGISQYSGSIVSQPTMFASGGNVMGEAGPEGIFPLKRGKDGKLGVSADGAIGTNVVVNLIESPGNGGQVNQTQSGNNLTLDIMVEKIEGMMGRNISQGRGIAPTMERQYGLNRAAGSY